MKTEYQEFEVQVPKIDGSGVAEKAKVRIPVYWDEDIKDWIMTPEAHEIIDHTKARLIGLLLPAQIKELRERFDCSQKEMGELLQVGEKSWTRWETGKQRPSRSMNLLIRALYDGEISINYLLERAGKPPRAVKSPVLPAVEAWHRLVWAMDWHLLAKTAIATVDAEGEKCTIVHHSQPKSTEWGSLLRATPTRQPVLIKRNRRFDYQNADLV